MESLCSNFLVKQDPNFYGGEQEDYQALSRQAISEGARLMKDSISFRQLLDYFREKRHEIAEKHNTPYKEHFFLFPTYPQIFTIGYSFFDSAISHLHNFPTGNTMFLRKIESILSDWKQDLNTFSKKSEKIQETIGERVFSYELDIVEPGDPIYEEMAKAPQFPHDATFEDRKSVV